MSATQQRGLGKGLSALMSDSYSKQAAPEAAAKPAEKGVAPAGNSQLPINRIHPGKFQPRTRFSEEYLQELSQSIKKNGLMQPIIVRPSTQVKGAYEIIAGERRWRAAKMAGLEMIPALLREIGDEQALELAIVENVQRQDLTPLEEAGGYQKLIDEFGYTQEDLSKTIGKSRSHIANMLRLMALPDPIKEMLQDDKITMGHARALLAAKNPVELAQEILRRGLNVRQVENLSRESQGVEKKSRSKQSAGGSAPSAQQASAPAAQKDADILALEETLSENLGLTVSINDRGQSGEIVIAYSTLKQLDEILRRLGGAI